MIRKNRRPESNGDSSSSSGSSRPSANRTGVTENGVTYSPSGKAYEDSNAYYSEILARFADSSMSLEELYSYLANGLSGNNMTTEQREDFLKQMIDSMLAKRQLDEQRAYDNPLAQLQRLMATGMSKDAALQALAGGAAGGSSAGSALIGAAGSPAPSESYANEVAAKTSIANTVFNGFQCAASLSNFGISIPGQIANNTIAQVSAKATTQAQTALESVNAGVDVLNACVDAGIISREDADAASRGSRTLDAALQYCAKKDPNSDAAHFLSSPQYQELSQNPFSSRVASERYMQARSGDDYALDFNHRMRLQMGAEILQGLDIDIAAEDLTKVITENEGAVIDNFIKYYNLENVLPAQVREIYSNIGLNDANIRLTNGEIQLIPLRRKFMKSQTYLNNSQANLNTQQAKLIPSQIRVNNAQAEYSRSLARVNNANAWKFETDNGLYKGALNTFIPADISFTGTDMTGAQLVKSSMFYNFYQQALTSAAITDSKYQVNYMSALYSNAEFNAINALTRSLYMTDFLRGYQTEGDTRKYLRGLQWTFYNPLDGGSNFGAAAGTAGSAAGTIGTILKYAPK